MSRLVEKPEDFDHEDDRRHEEAEEQPVVEELEVGRDGHHAKNTLVHGVHDEHDREGESDGQGQVLFPEQQRHLGDDQKAAKKFKLWPGD